MRVLIGTALTVIGVWLVLSAALGVPLLTEGPHDVRVHLSGRILIVLGSGLVMWGMSIS